MRVLVADIDAERLREAEAALAAESIEAASVVCDVGERAQVDAAVAAAVERWGGLDVAVANAGIVRAADFLEMEESDWDAVLRVNLKGAFLVRSLGRVLWRWAMVHADSGGTLCCCGLSKLQLKRRCAHVLPQTGQAAAKQMVAQGRGGTIINMSSVVGGRRRWAGGRQEGGVSHAGRHGLQGSAAQLPACRPSNHPPARRTA